MVGHLHTDTPSTPFSDKHFATHTSTNTLTLFRDTELGFGDPLTNPFPTLSACVALVLSQRCLLFYRYKFIKTEDDIFFLPQIDVFTETLI